MSFDKQKFYEKTNGGLDFFLEEFSSEIGANQGKMKGFRVRQDDRTGSCHIKKGENGIYIYRDFGSMSKAVNAIDYVMQRDACDFVNACKTLFAQFQIEEDKQAFHKPITEFSSDVKEEKGYWNADFHKEIRNKTYLRRIFPFYTDEVLEDYNFKEINFYENVGFSETKNNLYHRTITATEDYPIFGYDYKDFVKLYAPSAPKNDKFLTKHSFIGNKPKRIVYGWDRLFKKYEKLFYDIDLLRCSLDDEDDRKQIARINKDIHKRKIDSIIIATGGSDGINLASLGYDVIWFNSEQEIISKNEFFELKKYFKNIYYIPDNDTTGVAMGKKAGFLHLDLKIVWLPKKINNNFKEIKDFRDWITAQKHEPIEKIQFIFNRMLKSALNFRFWEYSQSGAVSINKKKLEKFLVFNDFYHYQEDVLRDKVGKEDDSIFVQVKDNVVSQVYPSEIERFVLDWLDKGFHDTKVYNKVFGSNFFTQKNLKNLNILKYKEKHFGEDYQYYIFKNTAIKVSNSEISEVKFKNLDFVFWDDKINKRSIELDSEPYFEPYKDENGKNRVKILNDKCDFMRYMINGSRVFWQKEMSEKEQRENKSTFTLNSDKLEVEEQIIQEQHFLNKCYAIGYVAHSFKIESLSWYVSVIDDAIKDSVSDANGGTGKSFMFRGLREFLKIWTEDGKKEIKGDNHFLAGVDSSYDLIYLEDLEDKRALRRMYNFVTNDMQINPKIRNGYTIRYNDSPKLAGTQNYLLNDGKGSTLRRMFYVSFGNYYHSEGNGLKGSYQIRDDFGYDLFSSKWGADKWNNFFNFLIQCVHFYLKNQMNPYKAPMDNIKINSLKAQIGDSFIEWADEYFTDENRFNNKIAINSIYDDYKGEIKYAVNKKPFKNIMELYCELKGYIFNPQRLQDSKGQIRESYKCMLTQTRKQRLCWYIENPALLEKNEPNGENLLPI